MKTILFAQDWQWPSHPVPGYGLCLLAGALITFSLAPFDYWVLSLFAMLALQFALQNANTHQAMIRGFLFCTGLMASGSYWIYVSIHDHGGASPALAAIMTAGLLVFLASWFIPLAWFYQRYIRDTALGNSLGFTAIWMLYEWLKTWLLTGFPWLFLGYSQIDGPLASWAPVISVNGLSFIICLSSAVIASNIQAKKPNLLSVIVLAFWLLPFYLGGIEWTEKKSDRAYQVTLLQPNIDLEIKWNPAFREPILEQYRQKTFAHADKDIIIWPETAVPLSLMEANEYLEPVRDFANDTDTAIILGIPSRWYKNDDVVVHNTMIGLGQADGIYHKQKLVPFGEYVPLESLLRGLIRFFDLPMSNFSRGPSGQEGLQAKDLNIMPYICYEVVYPEFVANTSHHADILLTVSNDAWFGESIGPIQHMQIARMRALELGRYMLRGTNNGVTGIIDHKGRIIKQLPQFTDDVLSGEVYAYKGLTPVAQYGTLAPVFLSFLILFVLTVISYRKNKH